MAKEVIHYCVTGDGQALGRAIDIVHKRLNSEHVVRDKALSGSRLRIDRHRIGDYLEEVVIRIPDERVHRDRFYLHFHVRDDAKSFWKDIVVQSMMAIADAGCEVFRVADHPEEEAKMAESKG